MSPTEPTISSEKPSRYVVIGASAGALESLERFFMNWPDMDNTAFIVIQHLSPDYESIMDTLIARYTSMQVKMIQDKANIKANTIHLIPPGTIIKLDDGVFKVDKKTTKTLTLPIDIFLNSAAWQWQRDLYAIILSGTGSDGTRGIQSVHEYGGTIIVQEPSDAKFDGMPVSAISTSLVNAVMKASEMPKWVMEYDNQRPVRIRINRDGIQKGPESAISQVISPFDRIMNIYVNGAKIDFSEYKRATICRRLERRMQLTKMLTIEKYAHYLKTHEEETEILSKDILIPVTNFFRDKPVFDFIETDVVSKLVEASIKEKRAIRVWVAGCSTGEEAYSLAMLFNEAFQAKEARPNVKLFATDINPSNIEFASTGVYPSSVANEIAANRLQKWFDELENGYKIAPEIRRQIVFAAHNLLQDAPFTKMDLVSCRNTLIYFNSSAQKTAVAKLQFAGRINSYLLLGSSEVLSIQEDAYEVTASKLKIYQKTKKTEMSAEHLELTSKSVLTNSAGRRSKSTTSIKHKRNYIDIASEVILENFSPPTILTDDYAKVVHTFGDVRPYWSISRGVASLELSKVLPAQLAPIAHMLFMRARKSLKKEVSDVVRFTNGDTEDRALLSVMPFKDNGHLYFLLSFDKTLPTNHDSVISIENIGNDALKRIQILESELDATRESLQTTIEELETSNEELQATNEELMASNEEMQSSNEELQSVNEELNTVNAEYHEKMSMLNRTNADLNGISKATGIATIFLNEKLEITRFTPDCVNLFKIREADIGRPIDEIVNSIQYHELIADLEDTIPLWRTIEKEISTDDGEHYLMRMLPYQVPSTEGRGVVASFIDISSTKRTEELQTVLDALPEHIAVIDKTGKIGMVNKAWEKFAMANGCTDLNTCSVGANYLDACYSSKNADSLTEVGEGLKQVLDGSSPFFTTKYPCHSPTEKRWFVMHVVPLQHEKYTAVVSHFNVSVWFDQDK